MSLHRLIQLTIRSVKDSTVPYPSAAIEVVDHFAQWDELGIKVDMDEDHIIQSWSRDTNPSRVVKQKPWYHSIGTLPPFLRYRFPFNYVSLPHRMQLIPDHFDSPSCRVPCPSWPDVSSTLGSHTTDGKALPAFDGYPTVVS